MSAAYAGARGEYVILTGRPDEPVSTGPTNGASVDLDAVSERLFSGRSIEVTVVARAAGRGDLDFAVAYSTNEVGNSGWRTFTADAEFEAYTFAYRPATLNEGRGDYVGVLPPQEGALEVALIAVTLAPEAAVVENPAAPESEAEDAPAEDGER